MKPVDSLFEQIASFPHLLRSLRRDDSLNPDGYGLGTLYAVLRSAGWSL